MLIFWDNYIVAVPTYYETERHKHAMLHILVSSEPVEVFSENKHVAGTVVLVDQDVDHRAVLKTKNSLVIFVDPSTQAADFLREQYLKNNQILELNFSADLSVKDKDEAQVIEQTKHILNKLGISNSDKRIKDERIVMVMDAIKDRRFLFMTIPEIASEVSLSPSRLAHLFKQQTGMRLKNCQLMYRLKYAYQAVLNGKSLTRAAMDLGFSDSAHLSAVAKSTTGLSITTFLRE